MFGEGNALSSIWVVSFLKGNLSEIKRGRGIWVGLRAQSLGDLEYAYRTVLEFLVRVVVEFGEGEVGEQNEG